MISVIICSNRAARFEAVCANYRARLEGLSCEIVGVHDATSMCEGYTRGLARAQGEVVIFSHDDIEILAPDFAAKLVARLEEYDVLGVAGTSRLTDMNWLKSGQPWVHGLVIHGQDGAFDLTLYGAEGPVTDGLQALDGLFIATRRDVAREIGFDAQTFDGWHGYDIDFTFRCHLAALRLAVCPDFAIVHASRGDTTGAYEYYRQRFLAKHGARLAHGEGEQRFLSKGVPSREAVLAALDFRMLAGVTRKLRVPAP